MQTTLLHSLQAAHAHYGTKAVVHEEAPDREMLHEFFADPAKYAFWFQMYKLRGRQLRAQRHENDLLARRRTHVTEYEDRDLAGDVSFALYQHCVGNISDAQLRIYLAEALRTPYHPPFLTLYLTASPERLVERVRAGGNPDEMAYYDRAYFCLADACTRAALELVRCPYVAIDWDEQQPAVAARRDAAWAARTLVPPARCLEVLEYAMAQTYGANIARIHALRAAGQLVVRPSDNDAGSDEASASTDENDADPDRVPDFGLARSAGGLPRSASPEQLLQTTKTLVLKHADSARRV